MSKVMGYKNRETYQMALSLMNEKKEYDYWSGMARVAKEEKPNRDEQIFILKHKIEETVYRILDNISEEQAGKWVFLNIVREGLVKVNWQEIAERFLEEIEE